MPLTETVILPGELASLPDDGRAAIEISSNNIARLSEKLQATTMKLDRVETLVKELKQRKTPMVYNPFALVLIDGDDTLFLDSLVQCGAEGGRDALRLLKQSVSEYLTGELQKQTNIKILVQVLANVEGLGKIYHQAKVIPDPKKFHKFVQGFNQSDPLCEFIDAGSDKEAADFKIKCKIGFWEQNVCCEHIILGASRDNGYIPFLRAAITDGIDGRITLLKAKPFAPNFGEVATSFKVKAFDTVFRKQDLINKSSEYLTKKDSPPAHARAFSNSAPSTPRSKYSPSSATEDTIGSLGAPLPECHKGSCTHGVHLNATGQRIDKWIEIDWSMVTKLRRRGICLQYSLTQCTDTECNFDHIGQLTPEEIKACQILAREIPCNIPQCRQGDCMSGHHCIHNMTCKEGERCPFPKDMHKIDTKIQSVIV